MTGQWDLRTLIDVLPVGVCACEAPSGRIVFFNAHAAQLWGRAPRLGGESGERWCGSSRAWRADGSPLRIEDGPMAMALRRNRAVRNEDVVIERPDGTRVSVLVNVDPLRDPDGRLVGAINVFHQTPALHRAALMQARLAAIVESSDDAIVSKDLDGIITSWNRGAERIFGYAEAEVLGKSITILIPPDRQDEEPRILAHVRRGERIDHYATVRRRKDGTLIDISLTISPMFDAFGAVVGASKIAREITDHRRAEDQRTQLLGAAERAREEAEAANRAKDEFLAMLGHELRNPLSAVRNAIVAATLDASSRDRALEIARRQTDQLTRLVDDLLDVARITRGRVPLRKERVVLAEVLQGAFDGARAAMEERGHTMTLQVPDEPIHLVADPARLQQAFANVLSNAAKYTQPGGTVAIEAGRESEDAVIRMRDNGVGIAPDVLPRIFDVFVQGDRALDRAKGGLGIGLTLVRRIVELHGGTVSARSAGIGHGAEFTIRLPALVPLPSQPSVPSAAASVRPRRQQPARVLMIEDNPDAAESLVMILELLGHHVRVVHDGMAGLDAARVNVPDLVLVDIGLPGMDGYEVARAMRRDPALRHVILVALTGYGRAEDKAQAIASGFDYHLAKPVDIDVLGELVGRLGASKATAAPGETRH